MRQPKPWFWKARNAWFVQLAGKQVKLHANEKEAYAEFYRIMAAEGRLDGQYAGRLTVADAVEALCESVSHMRSSTRRLYRYNLGPFAERFPTRKLGSITPAEVIQFVRTYQGRAVPRQSFGDVSRYMIFRFVKTLFRWARDTGLIQINQMHGVPNPWRSDANRRRVMTEAEYRAIMDDPKNDDRFKEVMEILWRTGARPGEVACIEARHLDPHMPIARLQPTEHKTGTKTGLQREIVFPADLMAKLRGYAVDRPRGPLLRNRRGRPWTQKRISAYFGRAKRRIGLSGDLVIYMARHAFATRMLDEGVEAPIAAKILGHTSAEVIQQVYYHPDMQQMVEIVGGSRPVQERGRAAAEKRKRDQSR